MISSSKNGKDSSICGGWREVWGAIISLLQSWLYPMLGGCCGWGPPSWWQSLAEPHFSGCLWFLDSFLPFQEKKKKKLLFLGEKWPPSEKYSENFSRENVDFRRKPGALRGFFCWQIWWFWGLHADGSKMCELQPHLPPTTAAAGVWRGHPHICRLSQDSREAPADSLPSFSSHLHHHPSSEEPCVRVCVQNA